MFEMGTCEADDATVRVDELITTPCLDGGVLCAEHFAEHLAKCNACSADVAASMDLED